MMKHLALLNVQARKGQKKKKREEVSTVNISVFDIFAYPYILYPLAPCSCMQNHLS